MNKTIQLIIVIALTSINFTSFSQIREHRDGLYYNQSDELYTGSYTEFYDNGNKRVEMHLRDGEKHGKIILYFESENIQEIRSYAQGLMHGTWMTWNSVDIKIAEANYKNNLKHGKWFIWDDAGTLRYQMEYTKGKKTGHWIIWNSEGKKIKEKQY